MNPNENSQIDKKITLEEKELDAEPVEPAYPVYTESKSSKIIRETGAVVGTLGMIAGLISTIKSLFRLK